MWVSRDEVNINYFQLWKKQPRKHDIRGHWVFIGTMDDSGLVLPIELLQNEIPPGRCYEVGEILLQELKFCDVRVKY